MSGDRADGGAAGASEPGSSEAGSAPPPVRQLRLVLTADDLDAAVAFYSGALGLPEWASFEDPEGRVVILDAGHATLEIADASHARYVDRVEGVPDAERPATQVRVAFEVADAEGVTRRLTAAGARLVADPVRTPWNSLNARLQSPDALELTVFEELPAPAGDPERQEDPATSER